jgi:hypothetical protein
VDDLRQEDKDSPNEWMRSFDRDNSCRGSKSFFCGQKIWATRTIIHKRKKNWATRTIIHKRSM